MRDNGHPRFRLKLAPTRSTTQTPSAVGEEACIIHPVAVQVDLELLRWVTRMVNVQFAQKGVRCHIDIVVTHADHSCDDRLTRRSAHQQQAEETDNGSHSTMRMAHAFW